MTKYDIHIGRVEESEQDEICAICGHLCTTYGQIESTTFYFCDDHKHLATPENLIVEYEILNED